MSPDTGLRVLFVEPDNDLQYVMSTLLRLIGCNVESVTTGAEALECVKAFAPDVVISELGLSDINGFELARQIRKLPNASGILLLALSGYHKENTEAAALQAGFAHLLLKPLPSERIVAVLEPIAASRGRTLVS